MPWERKEEADQRDPGQGDPSPGPAGAEQRWLIGGKRVPICAYARVSNGGTSRGFLTRAVIAFYVPLNLQIQTMGAGSAPR